MNKGTPWWGGEVYVKKGNMEASVFIQLTLCFSPTLWTTQGFSLGFNLFPDFTLCNIKPAVTEYKNDIDQISISQIQASAKSEKDLQMLGHLAGWWQ